MARFLFSRRWNIIQFKAKKRFQKLRIFTHMKFIICIKQVPDVYAPIQIKNGELSMDSDRMVINAYDASAVEEALVIAEANGGSVEVVLVGPEKAKETIRKALAMGADAGHHIVIEDTSNLDSAAYAVILKAFFAKQEYDVIGCGKQSQDTDAGLAGGMLAAHLGIPFAANAVGLTAEGEKMVVKRQGDSGQEMLELPTPCLVTCSNDMNNPRIPSLKGIMASKKKPVESHTVDTLGLDLNALRSDVVKTKTTGYMAMPAREPGKKFDGDPEELVSNVMHLLQNEAKVL